MEIVSSYPMCQPPLGERSPQALPQVYKLSGDASIRPASVLSQPMLHFPDVGHSTLQRRMPQDTLSSELQQAPY